MEKSKNISLEESLAEFYGNLFTSLIKKGFDENQALRIILTIRPEKRLISGIVRGDDKINIAELIKNLQRKIDEKK